MEYAINLADSGKTLIFEDRFKLASLCDEIAACVESGAQVNSKTELSFVQQIKHMYQTNGDFRSEIERLPNAKRYVKSLLD